MTMGKANPQSTMGDDLGQRKVGGIDIEIALDDLQIRSDLTEELVCFFVREVS